MEFRFANYGQIRDRLATEGELEMFDVIASMVDDPALSLVRKCDDYVSAVIGDWDLARLKYTPRAKWIVLPLTEHGTKKLRIQSPGEIAQFEHLIAESVETIKKF